MPRIAKVFPSILLFLGLMAPAADAAKPQFLSGTATVTDGELGPTGLAAASSVGFHGGLLVSFVEVGLGENEGTDYIVTADATAEYACINNGGNHPQAENKGTVAGPVSATGTLTAGSDGRVTGSLPVPPLGPGGLSCPPGQTLVLISVSYTNVVITDTTHGVSLSIPGTFSLTLVTLP